MKKRIIVSMMILCMIVFSISTVHAATGSAELTASKTSVKAGETFTVTLSLKCEDGLNGVDTSYSYNQEKLELVSANVANSNWASMGVDQNIQLICNNQSTIKSDDVYVLTFKVKDNVAAGTKIEISTSEIKVDSDVSASNFIEAAKTVEITVPSEGSNEGNNGGTTTPGGNTGITTPGSSTTTNKGNVTSNSDGSVKGKKLPQTGVNDVVIMTLMGTAVMAAVVFFVKIQLIDKK